MTGGTILPAFAAMLAFQVATATVQPTQPRWVKVPRPEAFERYYPKGAAAKGIEGWALVQCTVTEAGKLDPCRVVDERPQEAGFGDAALQMMQFFSMKRRAVDGTSTAGGFVKIPIRFLLPSRPSPPSSPR
jgi:TonB family protein